MFQLNIPLSCEPSSFGHDLTHLIPDSITDDTWCFVDGTWCFVDDTWCFFDDTRCFVDGTWCLVKVGIEINVLDHFDKNVFSVALPYLLR